jgi:Leucine-rich repeat (LRR) protein
MSCLELNGALWALGSTMRDLTKACRVSSKSGDRRQNDESPPSLTSLKLEDFDLDTLVAAKIIQLFQKHSNTLQHLTLSECTGHVDLVLTVALTALPKLSTLRIATGQISTTAFDPCANALGVGLQGNSCLRELTLQSGSNVFFTLSTDAAVTLADGLARNCILERFDLVGCRFDDVSTLPSLARGIRRHNVFKQVQIKSCFQSDGHALEDGALAYLILALGKHNRQLKLLDLTGNRCLSAGITAISELLDQTKLESVDLSCQCIVTNAAGANDEEGTEGEEGSSASSYVDLSLLVAALGRTNTLERLELRCNQLIDSDMAYLAAALTHNTSIRYLGLAGNRISNVGLSILASRIPNMRGLKRLVLTNNQYDADGLAELAHAIKDNVTLECVELDVCCGATSQEVSFPWTEIQYFADLNWAGRRYLINSQSYNRALSPAALWALVLARTNELLVNKSHGKERQLNVLYTFLSQGTVLFPM